MTDHFGGCWTLLPLIVQFLLGRWVTYIFCTWQLIVWLWVQSLHWAKDFCSVGVLLIDFFAWLLSHSHHLLCDVPVIDYFLFGHWVKYCWLLMMWLWVKSPSVKHLLLGGVPEVENEKFLLAHWVKYCILDLSCSSLMPECRIHITTLKYIMCGEWCPKSADYNLQVSSPKSLLCQMLPTHSRTLLCVQSYNKGWFCRPYDL